MLLGKPPQPLVEEMPTEQPAFFMPISRALFADEENIRQWFARVCATLDHNLTGVTTFLKHSTTSLTWCASSLIS